MTESNSLTEFLAHSMEREFREESHPLKDALKNARVNTYPLGYFRWVGRGGKPEFVGFSTVDKKAYELRPNTAEVDRPMSLPSYPAESLKAVHNSIVGLLADTELSVPLWVNLMCMKEAIESESDLVGKIIL
jgi:hypothetical protein